MKKKLSIKARITLWYASLIVIICAAALISLFAMAEQAQMTYCRDTLESAAMIIIDELDVEEGDLEIDSDIDEVPNVYASLFDLSGELVYGRRRVSTPFEEGDMRRVQENGNSWYILDTLMTFTDRENVWLRVHMSANLSIGVYQAMLHYGIWLLPLLAAVALGGGYYLTRRALRPVKEMSQVASSIAGGGDLSGRIPMAGWENSRDELYALGDTLNEMLTRLESAFEHERQFTSDAAHELRTPLNAMRTQGEYALSREDAKEKDEAIAQMLDKNEEMRALVDQLLMIARMEAGQTPMDDDVNLAQLIAGVAGDMELVALERDIRIGTVLCAASVRGNRAMLTRAVVNLVDNAIRYGREGGFVRISLAEEDEAVLIQVRDNGGGIEQEQLEHVFERFWRGDAARTSTGTGIGLAIVQAAARAHGGSASAESTVGEGSCFTIRLPKKKS